jgi:hypothetical protein
VKSLWNAQKIPWRFMSPSPARVVVAVSEREALLVDPGLPI